MGLVTGPDACTPHIHSQWVAGLGRTPVRTDGRMLESARLRTPHTQARGAPPCALVLPPQRAKQAHKSRPARRGALDPKQGKGTKGPGQPPTS